jgi:hypothetical protein
MKKMALVLAGVVMMFGAGNLLAKSSIAVLPFNIDRGLEVEVTGPDGKVLNLKRNLILREFSNRLNMFLTRSRKFTVLDREYISKVIDENKLSESDWAKPGQEARVGKLLVSDYIVAGTINRLEFLVRRRYIKITGETKPRIVATFKVQFRVVEVKSGKVVYADQVIEKLKSQDVRREIPVTERRDWTLADYKDLLFEKTANKVGNGILAGIFPVKIASITGKTVVLNRGTGAGIIVGQLYDVFKLGGEIVDPDTKESLGTSEEKVGIIKILETTPRFSKASIVSSKVSLEKGWLCRPRKEEYKEPAPAYPKATPGW